MLSVNELYDANKKRKDSEVFQETKEICSHLANLIYGNTSARHYWSEQFKVEEWMTILDANTRYLKGNPNVNQQEINEFDQLLNNYKIRWKGIIHIVNIEFGEKFEKMDQLVHEEDMR